MRRALPLAGLSALCTGCGPTDQDVGFAGLLSMPVTFLGSLILPLALRRIRDGVRSRDRSDLRPATVGFAGALAFGLIGLVGGLLVDWDWDWELVGLAAFFAGSAGMLYTQLAWLAFDRNQPRFGRFALPTLALAQGFPSLLFAFAPAVGLQLPTDAFSAYTLVAWIFAGYFMIPPLVFFAIAAVTLSVRRKGRERLEL